MERDPAHRIAAPRELPDEPAPRPRVTFRTVDRGWDPGEVLEFIGDLEDRLRVLLALRGATETPQEPGDLVAGAEHEADEIRARAAAESERLRARAVEDARAISVAAKRDAVDALVWGRELAEEIVARARDQEAATYSRVAELRAVVRRTEQLLESVAGESAEASGPAHAFDDAIEVMLDEAPGPEEGTAPDGEAARVVPPEVRRLLDRLRAPGVGGR